MERIEWIRPVGDFNLQSSFLQCVSESGHLSHLNRKEQMRIQKPNLVLAIAVSCAVVMPNLSVAETSPGGPSSPREFLDHVRRLASQGSDSCQAAASTINSDGIVENSALVTSIPGAAAGTTGGLGKPVFTVTSNGDAKPSKTHPPNQGSLRWAIEQARIANGGWIVFSSALAEKTIRLASTLRLPSNLTIDGGCSGVEIIAPPAITEITITDSENIIITGLSFTKEEYDDKLDKIGDAIGVTNQFDRVAIVHNNFHRCGDGCVDIVRKSRLRTSSRATIAFNRFTRHNKVMLIGTLTCYTAHDAPGCETPLVRIHDELAPHVFVSVVANVFEGTSQRHPKVVSNAMVDLVNNFFTLGPTAYSNGTESAVYGAAAGTGGILIAEGNIFLNPGKSRQIGAGSVTAVRSASGGGRELDGIVAADNNLTIGAIHVVENEPMLARQFKIPPSSSFAVNEDNAAELAACLLRITGPGSAGAAWPEMCSEGSPNALPANALPAVSTHRP